MKQLIESWLGRIQPLVWNLLVFAAAIVIGLIIKFIIRVIFGYYKNVKDYSLFRSIITHPSGLLTHFIPLLVLNLMIPLMVVLDKEINALRSRVVEIALTISFAALLVSAINVFENYMLYDYDLLKADNLIKFIRDEHPESLPLNRVLINNPDQSTTDYRF